MKTNSHSFRNLFKTKFDKLPPGHKKIKSLINNIQNEYENEKDIYNLLISGIKLAKMLNFKDIEHWLYWELKGYDNSHKLPDYRKLSPEIKAFNPYIGWEPLDIYDHNLANSLKLDSLVLHF